MAMRKIDGTSNLFYDDANKTIYELMENGDLNPVRANGAALVADLNEASIIDSTTTAGTTYFCYAVPGTLSSAASWKISKTVDATGVKTWADGNANYDNVADNRASLSYS